jgi:hypothetical protein
MDTEPASPEALHFALHLARARGSDGLQGVWQADLVGPTPDERLHFDSLPALIRYLSRLDPQRPPARGIR